MMDQQFTPNEIENNVFSFSNPDGLECMVREYVAGHSMMTVQVFDPANREIRIIGFDWVRYFSGPLKWIGANFQIQPWNECVQLLKDLDQIQALNTAPSEMRQEIGEKLFRLYTVSAISPKIGIKILAAIGRLITDIHIP